jgi:hypothetical protein
LDAQELLDGSDGPEGPSNRSGPDYEAWTDIHEFTSSKLAELAQALLRRPLIDVAVIVAEIGLTVLACVVVKYGGSAMPPPQSLIGVLVIALLLGAPVLSSSIPRQSGVPENAENSDGKESPPESRVV